jgi:hypothetical protein
MKNAIEDELRAHFGRTAAHFDMERTMHPSVLRRARRRAFRGTTLAVGAAVVIASISFLSIRGDQTTTAPSAPVIKLVDYAPPDSEDSPDDPAFQAAFQQHVDCMRQQGFDVPDPVKTGHGWQITFAPGTDPLQDPRWREAALVTCSIDKFTHRPLTGDLVMGFPKDKIDAFIACMRTQGYDLPEPSIGGDGQYRWPLKDLRIDTASDDWNRAVFIACSPTGN